MQDFGNPDALIVQGSVSCRDFPGGLEVKTLPSHCREFDLWSRNQGLACHTAQQGSTEYCLFTTQTSWSQDFFIFLILRTLEF